MSLQSNTIRGSFVVGCGHSGTSILIRILAEHSQIYAIPNETRILFQELGRFFKRPNLDKIFEQLNNFDNLARIKGKTMWVEKTPKHVRRINLIFKVRKDAKVIGITRDPRDVACSIKNRGLTFEAGILRWIKDNTALLKNKRENILIIRLEDIIKNPKNNVKKILDFLELPHENLLNFYLHPKDWYAQKVITKKPLSSIGNQNHNMLRNWQINQPMFKTTQRYTTDMTKEDKKIFAKYAKEIEALAKQLGYLPTSEVV